MVFKTALKRCQKFIYNIIFMTLQIAIGITTVILAMGTAYAWYQFYNVVRNRCDTCSVGLHQSPFKSKCFVGAVFFTAAFIPSLYSCFLVSGM